MIVKVKLSTKIVSGVRQAIIHDQAKSFVHQTKASKEIITKMNKRLVAYFHAKQTGTDIELLNEIQGLNW